MNICSCVVHSRPGTGAQVAARLAQLPGVEVHAGTPADYTKQENRSSQGHQAAEDAGLTCIDCHKGIAHSLPMQYDPEQDAPGTSVFYSRLEDPHAGTKTPAAQK